MPFYIKRKNGKWEEIEKELPISRRPSNEVIVVLFVSEKDPGEVRAKVMGQKNITIELGPGLKHVAMHETIIKKEDFMVYDHETGNRVVVIFSSEDIVSSGDTSKISFNS